MKNWKAYACAAALLLCLAGVGNSASYFEKSGTNSTSGWQAQNSSNGNTVNLAVYPQCRYHEFWAWTQNSSTGSWAMSVNASRRGGAHVASGQFQIASNNTVSFNGTSFDSLKLAPTNAKDEWSYVYRCWE